MTQVLVGDCRDQLARLRDAGAAFHAVVTDPPYELGLHGKAWDATGITFDPDLWKMVFNVLRPGGYLAAFAAPRQYHRLAEAVEKAGFIVHPFLLWRSGNGLPKPVNLSELFDRENAPRRRILGQRQGSGFTTANVAHGAQSRTKLRFPMRRRGVSPEAREWAGYYYGLNTLKPDGEPILLAQRPIATRRMIDNIRQFGVGALNVGALRDRHGAWPSTVIEARRTRRADHGSDHPSVKPLKLMEDLCLLLCPPGGSILDPFAGTGTTGVAATAHGFGYTLVERDPQMADVIAHRLGSSPGEPEEALHVPAETALETLTHVTPLRRGSRKSTLAVRHCEKVRAYREALPERGLRAVQLWGWDTRSGEFAAEAWRQSHAIAASLALPASRDVRPDEVRATVDA